MVTRPRFMYTWYLLIKAAFVLAFVPFVGTGDVSTLFWTGGLSLAFAPLMAFVESLA